MQKKFTDTYSKEKLKIFNYVIIGNIMGKISRTNKGK